MSNVPITVPCLICGEPLPRDLSGRNPEVAYMDGWHHKACLDAWNGEPGAVEDMHTPHLEATIQSALVGLEKHEITGIVTVPHYVGNALSRLCDITRRLEIERIASYLERSNDPLAHAGPHFAEMIREGRHHD